MNRNYRYTLILIATLSAVAAAILSFRFLLHLPK